MIGPKTLSAIRLDLRRALARKGEDPIRRLEKLIKEAERNGTLEGERDVLFSLYRVIQAPTHEKRGKRRTGTN